MITFDHYPWNKFEDINKIFNFLLLFFISLYFCFSKCKTPLQPKVTLHIATTKVQDEVPKPIPIMGAQIKDDLDQTILFAHGHFLKPTFEKQVYIYEL